MQNNKLKDLKNAFNGNFEVLAAWAEKFPWEDRQAYAQWLAQTYYFVKHTTVFLTLTAAKFGVRNGDAHKGTLKHLREETGHEKLALNDLRNLGYDVADIPELLETSVLYQTQYYWIECFGPISHAGYALMLEGVAALHGEKILKRIEAAHGKNTGSFLRVHVIADDDHFDDGLERLAFAPDADVQAVIGNLTQSAALYLNLLETIQTKHTSQSETANVTAIKGKKAA
jgi:hypothetical protein